MEGEVGDRFDNFHCRGHVVGGCREVARHRVVERLELGLDGLGISGRDLRERSQPVVVLHLPG